MHENSITDITTAIIFGDSAPDLILVEFYKKIPAAYVVFHPLWVMFYHLIWKRENIMYFNRPIKIYVKNDYVEMLPQGHIAEVLWKHEFENLERKFIIRHLISGMCNVILCTTIGLLIARSIRE